MKKSLSIVTILVISWMLGNGLQAQTPISIISADMPNSGDTIRFSTGVLTPTILQTYAQGDTNFWDFSSLTPISQGLNEYVNASSTPYGLFFSGSFGLLTFDTLSLGTQFTLTDVYDFYNNSSAEFKTVGRGLRTLGFPLASFNNDDDEIYQFPLDYGDRDSTTFDYQTGIPFVATITSVGYRINDVDGWGIVVTPYDSLECIRVVTDIVSSDSINVAGVGGISIPNHTREFKWLAKGEKFPMVEISGNVILGAFIPTQVRFRDIYRGIPTFNPLAPVAAFSADNLFPEATVDTVTLFSEVLPLPSNTYSWSISPNTYTYVDSTDNNSGNPRVIFNASGTYNVGLYVSNNFGNDDSTALNYITVAAVNTSEVWKERALQVFPNPVTQQSFNISYELSAPTQVSISLLNANGQLVRWLTQQQQDSGEHSDTFPTKGLATGVYFLKIQFGDAIKTMPLMIK